MTCESPRMFFKIWCHSQFSHFWKITYNHFSREEIRRYLFQEETIDCDLIRVEKGDNLARFHTSFEFACLTFCPLAYWQLGNCGYRLHTRSIVDDKCVNPNICCSTFKHLPQVNIPNDFQSILVITKTKIKAYRIKKCTKVNKNWLCMYQTCIKSEHLA